jgi:predicted transcriptional regulator
MTTITLKLPEHLMEQAVQFAEERDTAVDAFLESALADYLEELQDIADAKEQSRRYEVGEIKGVQWEVFRAELLAMEDMQPFLEDDNGETE